MVAGSWVLVTGCWLLVKEIKKDNEKGYLVTSN